VIRILLHEHRPDVASQQATDAEMDMGSEYVRPLSCHASKPVRRVTIRRARLERWPAIDCALHNAYDALPFIADKRQPGGPKPLGSEPIHLVCELDLLH
jgi:hypothetical protein